MKKMNRFVAVLMAVLLLLASAPLRRAQAESASHPFNDIKGLPQEQQVAELWQLGVVSGLTANQYDPNGAVTRAQMAALIVRALGLTVDANQSAALEFSDVPANYWGRGVIALASQLNIIKGDGGKFSPNQTVNYAQAATMLVRALGYEGQVVGGYPTGYVIKANDLGLLKGTNFELAKGVNRAEAATMLYNMIYYAVDARTGQTLSQSHFRRAVSLKLKPLPAYAAPGQQLSLKAEAQDLAGNVLADVGVSLHITQGSGRISDDGVLTLGEGGPVTVQASLNGMTASATVTAVTGLQVEPETFQANKGGTIQLNATALAGGDRVAVRPQWKVVSGPATVDAEGLLTVTDYGAVVVRATLGDFTVESRGQAVGAVAIDQKPDYLVPGVAMNFTASVTDSTGRPIHVPTTWRATGASIDPNTGVLSNPRGARVTVTATAAGISDQVTIPVLQSIAIAPSVESVLIGRRLEFTAEGVDNAGNRYPLEPQWDRSDPAVGIVSADGAFAGIASGSVTVTAKVGTLEGRQQFRVAGAPSRLEISAAHDSLPSGVGASTTVTVKLLDQTGALSPVDDQPIVLALGSGAKGSISRTLVLTQQGRATVTYTAGTDAGTVTITASAPGTTLATQTETIRTYAQVPNHIALTATPSPLVVGGNVATITATLLDANDYPAVSTQTAYVTLSSSGGGGSLVGSSITIPAGQSSGSVSFISNGQAGTASITGTSAYTVDPISLRTVNAGPAAGVKIRPINGATPVTGLTSLQVVADVVDANNVVLVGDSDTEVQLAISLPGASDPVIQTATAVRGTTTFTVPATVVGNVGLTASIAGDDSAHSDTATTEFVPGVVSSLKLHVEPASLMADGYTTARVVAEVVDRDGTVLPSVNTTVTFRRLVDGSATTEESSLSVPTVGGRAVLSLRTTRSAGTDLWYASAPGLDTQNLATVTTSPSSGDGYSLRLSGSTSFNLNTSSTMVVQVVDQQGRVVSGDSGRTITATTSIPGVTVTPSAVTQNGAATFAVQATQTGSGSILFAAPGLPDPSITVPVSFGTGGSAYSLFVSSSSMSVPVGDSVTIWVRVMDNQGNVVTTDNGRRITASVSGRGSLESTLEKTASGMVSFTFTGVSYGTATVTIMATGLPQPQQTITITVTR